MSDQLLLSVPAVNRGLNRQYAPPHTHLPHLPIQFSAVDFSGVFSTTASSQQLIRYASMSFRAGRSIFQYENMLTTVRRDTQTDRASEHIGYCTWGCLGDKCLHYAVRDCLDMKHKPNCLIKASQIHLNIKLNLK